MQNGENNVGQACLHRRLFLAFYRAPARHEDEAKRNPNGMAQKANGTYRLIGRQPDMRMKRSEIRMAWRKKPMAHIDL